MPYIVEQLVEGWCALARSNVLLDYIEFAVSENICSQNYPSKFPQLEFSRIVFSKERLNCSSFVWAFRRLFAIWVNNTTSLRLLLSALPRRPLTLTRQSLIRD